MKAAVTALLWKETCQIPRKRSAVLTAVLFPLLFFVVLPVSNMFSLSSGITKTPVGVNVPSGFGNLSGDPDQLMRDFMLPLFITLGGLVIPAMTATYTIISEREKRTIELLVVLPVSLGQIVLAKLLAVLILGAGIALPLFLIDAAVMIGLGIASLADVLALLVLLVAALLYSTSCAFFVSLMAADFRTANNIQGLLLGPTILLTFGALVLLPGGALRSLLLGGAFLVLASALIIVALRALTIERFLR